MITMKNVVLAAGATLALMAPSALQAATSSGFPKEIKCDRPELNDIVTCQQGQVNVWDAILNTEYRTALKRVDENQRPLFVKAQRIWIQYRDANCAVQFAHPGTISTYLGEECLLNMTRQKAKELRELHTEDDD